MLSSEADQVASSLPEMTMYELDPAEDDEVLYSRPDYLTVGPLTEDQKIVLFRVMSYYAKINPSEHELKIVERFKAKWIVEK